ncbi:hypothetical protein BAE44_0000168 [Dichanthelium oligosanthes]|uniref:Uncharacterized protein n=1 Tax=Dichanthelium oligosanthes TaxID=888268 RepID=A0A1E5WN48_9POAL|nr:hypothetical protein BAE44_0000168 [Dichanthelium oligosanthes]
MDTVSYKWTQVGKWTLPFYGKVEYVPELNLWFGLSANAKALAAADLSAMDSRSRAQLVGPWNELDDGTPEECQDSHFPACEPGLWQVLHRKVLSKCGDGHDLEKK